MTFLPRCLLIVLVLCGQHYSQARADLVIINANVRTMTAGGRTARAIAVTGNKIMAVGTDRDILALAGPATEMIDAGGRITQRKMGETSFDELAAWAGKA